MAEHNELGKEGEKLAVEFLLKNDYKILEKNYRYLKAEVDIIAQKGAFLIGVEVKTSFCDWLLCGWEGFRCRSSVWYYCNFNQ